ncbi:MAG: hypothetical protein R3212_01480 [Xanthomonadales bacterium]|nr:hypothetical protein [Xanthomonadales bacterium]
MLTFRSIILAVVAVSATALTPAWAQLSSVDVSPDITLGLGAQTAADEDVGQDNLAGGVVLIDLGAIPSNADVTLFHRLDNGDRLFGLDITVELPGSVVATPADVVRFDGATYSIEFDGSAQGVPSGARLDALSSDNGNLLLSFDTTVVVSGFAVADEDIVEFNGASFSMVLDGSSAGVPDNVDVDALHFDPESGDLFVSFDISGTVSGTTFSDEDLLKYNAVGGSWSLAYDGSVLHSDWIAGDLDAAFVTFLIGFIFQDGFENL